MQIRLTFLSGALLCLVAGCASLGQWPEHEAQGGLLPKAPPLQDDPWAIDMDSMLETCGLGSGVVLSQLIRERGYAAGAGPNSLHVKLHCRWQRQDIQVWKVAAKTTRGVCTAPQVDHLEIELTVLASADDVPRATASFRGHQQLKAEPPHRGCKIEKEHKRALMARGLRAVLHTLPQGPKVVAAMVAPSPVSSGTMEAESGPRPETSSGSVYPVGVGPKPVPTEAVGDTRFFSPSDRPIQTADMAAGGPYPARFSPFWWKFSLALDLGVGGCTERCDQLFVAGPGFGLRLLFRPLDHLAIETGLGWYSLGNRQPTMNNRHFEPDFSSIELGGRIYPGGTGNLEPYAFLGVIQAAVGHDFDSLKTDQSGLRYVGRGPALRLGLSYPIWNRLRLGAHAGYSFIFWTQLCSREPAFLMGGLGCTDLAEQDKMLPSNTWSVGAELGLRFE